MTVKVCVQNILNMAITNMAKTNMAKTNMARTNMALPSTILRNWGIRELHIQRWIFVNVNIHSRKYEQLKKLKTCEHTLVHVHAHFNECNPIHIRIRLTPSTISQSTNPGLSSVIFIL